MFYSLFSIVLLHSIILCISVLPELHQIVYVNTNDFSVVIPKQIIFNHGLSSTYFLNFNPITVRLNGDKYEIIAGQRRFLAMKQLNKTHIPCNVLTIDTQKAEEISLVENVQRNQMTTCDKVRSYSKLYDVYNKDIDKEYPQFIFQNKLFKNI